MSVRAVADTAAFVEHYGRELLGRSANCVVVAPEVIEGLAR